ncbi:MAG: helix-turn-helix transcriptional regulator, partial [Polyangiaceae bacterium]
TRGDTEGKAFDVNPLGLVVRGSLLTLVGTLGKGSAPRQLHLHRMRDARPTTRSAHVPEGFDLDAHIREGNLSFLLGTTLRLRARFSALVAPTLEETALSKGQRLTREADGGVILEASVSDTLDLRGWLASYGPHVEVLEPAELRAQVGQQARETAALYSIDTA